MVRLSNSLLSAPNVRLSLRNEGEANHFCPNYLHCPPQIKGRIEHFIGRKAMDIDGLGEETIDLLFSEGLIRNYADLYELKTEQACHLNAWVKNRQVI